MKVVAHMTPAPERDLIRVERFVAMSPLVSRAWWERGTLYFRIPERVKAREAYRFLGTLSSFRCVRETVPDIEEDVNRAIRLFDQLQAEFSAENPNYRRMSQLIAPLEEATDEIRYELLDP